MKKLIAWVEIPATDLNRAVKFYNSILDLEMEVLDFGQEKMACLPNDEGAIFQAEGYQPSKDGVLVSFETGSQLEETIRKIKELGGKITQDKTKIEAEGRAYFAHFIDTEGNRIGLYGE